MLQTVHNSEFSRTMDLFKEIDDLSDLFLSEKNTKLDCAEEGFEDLQSKYSSLHENYAKEIENSKKVEKCLIKCLKFYSKLSKKYEVQQQVIRNLEESVKEKVGNLEEAQKNEEKMKGLIQVYRTERTLYSGQTNMQLRKEKEILLDICCKLIGESVKSYSAGNFISLLLRKFKKDLSDEQIILLKSKSIKLKDELEADAFGDFKPDLGALKDEFKSEVKYSDDVTKLEMKDSTDDGKTDDLDLSSCNMENSCLDVENTHEDSDKSTVTEDEQELEAVPSLPSLEELQPSLGLCCTDEQEQGDVAVGVIAESDLSQDGSEPTRLTSYFEGENFSVQGKDSEYVEKLGAATVESHVNNRSEKEREERAKGSTSIFDICDTRVDVSDPKAENVPVETEYYSEVFFKCSEKSEEHFSGNDSNKVNLELTGPEGDPPFPYELEVYKIFREMASVRLLSPIREYDGSSINKIVPNESVEIRKSGPGLKRNSEVEEKCDKNKKFKSDDKKTESCLLDSIMSAMSIQNEEFKWKKSARNESGENGGEISEGSSSEFGSPRSRTHKRRNRKENGKPMVENSSVVCHTLGRNGVRQQTAEKLVTEEIKKFVSSPISCKEDADRYVKQCISGLTNKSEDVIAKCIVTMVLENIDEVVEIYERPAPPLTKTQHRLIVLLSVFRTLDWDSGKISAKILSIISEKLFPDNFFWPDDCVEAAARFYAALCRARNDPKTLWKFCINAMTDMRQRCPLIVFTVLKTWPDVLHDASKLKNNMLALTVVNVFLHMPKTEGLRNVNQKRKLVALKHLLINFYEFKVEDTIEGYAKKVVEGISREEVGSEKSVILLCKCRDQDWTLKNVVPALKKSLTDWFEERIGDSVAIAILSVIKQICPMLALENNAGTKVKDLAVYLCHILTSRKKTHDSEVNLIEVLLLLKQYPEVRKTISEWIPKQPIGDSLRNEIINASAENILRELKLNRKKETKNFSVKKKQWKKSKGKKKKGKKKKKNEQKSKAESTGIRSRD